MENAIKTIYFDYKLFTILPLLDWAKLTFNKYYCLIFILLGKKEVPFKYLDKVIYVSTIGDLGSTVSSLVDGYFDVYKILKKDSIKTIIDVGGNIGQFSNAMKHWFPESKIHVFEPDPIIYDILSKNTNNPNFFRYNLALSFSKGKLDFYRSKLSGMSSLVQVNKNQEVIQVDVETADNILSEISSIDLFKIDVEGAELSVLKGAYNTIKKSKYLLIEVSFDRPKNIDNTNMNVLAEIWKVAPNAEIIHIGRALGGGGVITAQDFLIKLNCQ
jgi:FkbM family methyltransferase